MIPNLTATLSHYDFTKLKDVVAKPEHVKKVGTKYS